MTNKQVKKTEQLFRKVKEGHAEHLLLFRFGDSYEAFFDDAERCSEVCGLDLTEREKDGGSIPLVTIPLWLIERYVRKLLQVGYTVSLCESLASGKTKRDIVRVVSPRCKDKTQRAKVYKRSSPPSPSNGRGSHHRPQLRLVRPAR